MKDQQKTAPGDEIKSEFEPPSDDGSENDIIFPEEKAAAIFEAYKDYRHT